MYSVKVEINDIDLNKIADSGQVFRMNKLHDNVYSIVAFNKYVEVEQRKDALIFSCSEDEYKEVWEKYFDLNLDYRVLTYKAILEDGTNILDDEFLLSAIAYGEGIRILRQEFFETLISFIISQRKNIPAIKTCIEKLCEKYGDRVIGTSLDGSGVIAYTFPSPETFWNLTIEDLKECGVGYRAEYIEDACNWYLYQFDVNFILQESVRDYIEAFNILKEDIKGVGDKVSNCVCLFGLHHLNACPKDVWVQKIIDNVYNGDTPGWMKSKYAGLLQQYAFYYIRSSEYRMAYNVTN